MFLLLRWKNVLTSEDRHRSRHKMVLWFKNVALQCFSTAYCFQMVVENFLCFGVCADWCFCITWSVSHCLSIRWWRCLHLSPPHFSEFQIFPEGRQPFSTLHSVFCAAAWSYRSDPESSSFPFSEDLLTPALLWCVPGTLRDTRGWSRSPAFPGRGLKCSKICCFSSSRSRSFNPMLEIYALKHRASWQMVNLACSWWANTWFVKNCPGWWPLQHEGQSSMHLTFATRWLLQTAFGAQGPWAGCSHLVCLFWDSTPYCWTWIFHLAPWKLADIFFFFSLLWLFFFSMCGIWRRSSSGVPTG